MTLQRILVINAKGGCGKTTIATNIASYYASQGLIVRLFDHDNQRSSLAWIDRRSQDINPIHGVDASKNFDQRLTRSWQLRVPPETDVAVLDTPAGIDVGELAALFQTNDSVIIPVLPSPIDIHATAHFIKELLTTGKARKQMVLCVQHYVRKEAGFGLQPSEAAGRRDGQRGARGIRDCVFIVGGQRERAFSVHGLDGVGDQIHQRVEDFIRFHSDELLPRVVLDHRQVLEDCRILGDFEGFLELDVELDIHILA